MKFREIFEVLIERQGFNSHEEAAEFLGLSRPTYFRLKKGETPLKDKTVERLMEGTGLEAPVIVAAWEAEHGRTEKVRESWKRWLESAAAVVILSAAAGLLVIDSPEISGIPAFNHSIHYAHILLAAAVLVAFRLLGYGRVAMVGFPKRRRTAFRAPMRLLFLQP